MSEVKRAGQQMQKVASGSAHTAKASGHKNQRSKPYDRPQNNRFNAFKRRPFLGHGRASTQTACTKTWNAGMPERRNAGILKPRTQNY